MLNNSNNGNNSISNDNATNKSSQSYWGFCLLLGLLFFLFILGICAYHKIDLAKGIINTNLSYLLPHEIVEDNDDAYYQSILKNEIVFLIKHESKQVASKIQKQASNQNLDSNISNSISDFNSTINPNSALSAKSSQDIKNELLQGLNEIQKLAPSAFIIKDKSKVDNLKEFYWQYRYSFPGSSYICKDCAQDETKLLALKSEILETIYAPFGGITESEVKYDPFLTMRHILQNNHNDFVIGKNGEIFKVFQGQKYEVIRLVLSDLITSETKEQIYELVLSLKAQITASNVNNNDADLLYTGELFFAKYAENSSKTDLSRISLISFILLFLIQILCFRSLVPFILTSIMLVISLFTGVLAILAIWGEIHSLTLVMGATLIGICVDYAIHIFMHKAKDQNSKLPNSKLLKQSIKLPLVLSLTTSILSYGLFSYTRLPVLNQLAVLSVVALLTTFLMVYYIFTSDKIVINVNEKFLIFLSNIAKSLPLKTLGIVLFVILGFSVYAYQGRVFDDDCAKMQNPDVVLQNMSKDIHKILTGGKLISYYRINGTSQEDALEKCHELKQSLTLTERRWVFLPCDNIIATSLQQENIASYKAMFASLAKIYAEEGLELSLVNTGLNDAHTFNVTDFPEDISKFVGENSVLMQVYVDEVEKPKNANSEVTTGLPVTALKDPSFSVLYKLTTNKNVERYERKEKWDRSFAYYHKELNYLAILILSIIVVISFIKKRILLGVAFTISFWVFLCFIKCKIICRWLFLHVHYSWGNYVTRVRG